MNGKPDDYVRLRVGYGASGGRRRKISRLVKLERLYARNAGLLELELRMAVKAPSGRSRSSRWTSGGWARWQAVHAGDGAGEGELGDGRRPRRLPGGFHW